MTVNQRLWDARWWLLLIAGVALVLRFVGLGELPLIGDEAYYWLWSENLDWAYYDHPAGMALLVRVSTALGGSGEFGVRWLNALLGAGCVLLTGVVGWRLLSRRAGAFAAVAVAVGAPYIITARFVYTDVLHLFLLLLNLLAFWRLTQADAGDGDALAFGLSLALLFNTKYSAYFYAVALLLAVFLDHRLLLRTRRLWVGGAIAALGLLPVFAWNAAHGWASFRWQLSHATLALGHAPSLLGRMYHAGGYLTWPLVLLALPGLGRWRTPAERLLVLVAACLLAPLLLSPANSPRNLSTGMVPLLLLAGTRLPAHFDSVTRRAVAGLLALGLAITALYGVGTVANLVGPSPLPHSTIVPTLRRDTAGWPALAGFLDQLPDPIFALDYSIAGQIRYYTGRPAYAVWGQYRVWGFPELEEGVTIVALDYLPADGVTRRLRDAFDAVWGPERLTFTERGAAKVVYLWLAEGLRWEEETFLQHFDFLNLMEALQ